MHASLPLDRTVLAAAAKSRTGGRRGARHGKNYGVGEEETRAKTPGGTWTNPSQDEERPPREEWPTAMKILTGTVALAPTEKRVSRSFYYCFFYFFLSLPPPRVYSPSHSLRERFTEAAHNVVRAPSPRDYLSLREGFSQKSHDARRHPRARDYAIATDEKQ